MRPCQGVCRRHLVEDKAVAVEAVAAFGSVVRAAQRTYENNMDILAGHHRWGGADVVVKGCLAGPRGGVSGVLGLVGRDDVFWSPGCAGVSTNFDGSKGVARCSGCKTFYRTGITPRAVQASRHTPSKCTRNQDLSTAQKVCASSDGRDIGEEDQMKLKLSNFHGPV